ncbi:MAG: hypothetical protein IIX16_00115 [Clostridia bacterium]|nr:hypothetical protein [Clostridia bacterium]
MENLNRKLSLTIGNYSQMANRLEKRNSIFQFVLIYYSIIGIVDALLPKYFDFTTNVSATMNNVFDFWDILIAIILLIFSSQIALFKYPERIKNCMVTLNQLKMLQGALLSSTQTVENAYKEYYEITQNINFLFSRSDFYLSCKNYDVKNQGSEVKTHFSQTEEFFISTRLVLENILYFILIFLPMVIYICLLVF